MNNIWVNISQLDTWGPSQKMGGVQSRAGQSKRNPSLQPRGASINMIWTGMRLRK